MEVLNNITEFMRDISMSLTKIDERLLSIETRLSAIEETRSSATEETRSSATEETRSSAEETRSSAEEKMDDVSYDELNDNIEKCINATVFNI